ncbi:hypothetical protein BDV96DRAFT_496359 [Lophiotrema nucula]|uniref:FAD-binding PCMH-type domain-containing protein n=1 Tax=Lophiotrema nucula TaxID=690887 RepID=A0A6A5Z2T1_9PLEO|nr:hypothetical protein BDV96DRAFT_496359 [Lophiotrema nucula]
MSSTTVVQDILTPVLGGKNVLEPGTKEYDEANGSYFTQFNNAIKPSFIAQPTSAGQVSSLVKALRPHLLSGDTQLAIRGTGHTPFAGSANIQDGITLDLRNLKKISLNDDKSVVEVGVGETWESLYTELEKHGLTAAGGRVARVGVTGFVLGGGLSLYSTRNGFACDSVLSFELVLASSEIVQANASSNPELWTSLKGGLNNFGILTSMKLKTIKSEPLWGGIAYYTPPTFSSFMAAAVDFALNEEDEDTHVIASAGYGFGQEVVVGCVYHTRGIEDAPSLQRFTSLPGLIESHSSLRKSSHIEAGEDLGRYTGHNVRTFYATLTIRPDLALIETMYAKYQSTLTQIKDAEGLTFSFGFMPLSKSMLANSLKAGGNAFDIPASDGPLFIVLVNPTWASVADDERVTAGTEKLVAEFRELAREKGLLHRWVFPNYAFWKEDLFKSYGEESVARLRGVAKTYDPEGIFQKAVPGGFKLEKSGQ